MKQPVSGKLIRYMKKAAVILLPLFLLFSVFLLVTSLISARENKLPEEGAAIVRSLSEQDAGAAVKAVREAAREERPSGHSSPDPGQEAEDPAGPDPAAAEDNAEPASGQEAEDPAEPASGQETEDPAGSDPGPEAGDPEILPSEKDRFTREFSGYLDEGTVPPLSEDELAAFRSRFSETVFFGDSMAQALGTYGIVPENRVLYLRGGVLQTLLPKADELAGLYPAQVIIWTGLNDCNFYMEKYEEYTQDLRTLLQKVSAVCGAENVTVLSLLPPSDALGAVRDDLRQAPVFDQILQNVAAEQGVRYLDTCWIVRQRLYDADGIHFQKEFYEILARYLMLGE